MIDKNERDRLQAIMKESNLKTDEYIGKIEQHFVEIDWIKSELRKQSNIFDDAFKSWWKLNNKQK